MAVRLSGWRCNVGAFNRFGGLLEVGLVFCGPSKVFIVGREKLKELQVMI